MRTVVVEVTAEDIAKGEPENCYECPVALATKRALEAGRVAVRPLNIYSWNEVGVWAKCDGMFPTPDNVRTFFQHFDCGLPVEPFTFTVELP